MYSSRFKSIARRMSYKDIADMKSDITRFKKGIKLSFVRSKAYSTGFSIQDEKLAHKSECHNSKANLCVSMFDTNRISDKCSIYHKKMLYMRRQHYGKWYLKVRDYNRLSMF